MPPTEDGSSVHADESMTPSSVDRLVTVVRTMLRNGIINQQHTVLLDPIDPYAPNAQPMPYLPNLRDLLRRITGQEDFTNVTELKLKVVSREMGLQHLSTHTPNLTELTLDGSVVSSLRDLGCRLHSLRVLKVNRCRLRCLDGINGMRHVEKLYAAHNRIADLTACTSMEFLRHLDVGGNLIEDMGVVEFLVLCGKLKDLVLEENYGVSDRADYRETVKRAVPQLRSLDGLEFEDEEEPVRQSRENSARDRLPSLPSTSTITSSTSGFVSGSSPGTSSTTTTILLDNAPSMTTQYVNNACYTVSFSPRLLSSSSSSSSAGTHNDSSDAASSSRSGSSLSTASSSSASASANAIDNATGSN